MSAHERVDVPRRQLRRPVARVLAEALPPPPGMRSSTEIRSLVDPDQVVRRVREAARAERRDRAGVDDEHPGDRPDVRDVAVAGQDEVDAALAQQREHVAGVEHLVALAAGARDRHQVVVADEDAQVGVAGEALLDPAVVLAPDLALVEVGLRRVDRDERDIEPGELEPQPRVPRAEGVLEEE